MQKVSNGYQTLNMVSNRYVGKRNDIIQNCRHSMGLVEYKIVLYVLSAVQPDDPDDKLYRYNVSTLYRILGEKTNSYSNVKACLDKVSTFGFWKDYKINGKLIGEKIDLVHSDSLILHFSDGYFELRFAEKIMPYIKQLQEQKRRGEFFTSYQIRNVMLMKHMYSIRIYELIKSYSNNKVWTMEIGTGSEHDLQLRIAKTDSRGKSIIPVAWKNWSNFEKDVMIPAAEDINKFTDLNIKYQPIKYDLTGNKHRKYVAVQFGICKKTEMELDIRNKHIDSIYMDIADENETYEFGVTNSINEFLVLNEENQKLMQEIRKEKELDERADKSAYPAFTHTFGADFTDQQLNNLIQFASEHIELGTILWKDRDIWLTNYVGHYKRKVDATPEKTTTTPYRRLLDLVEKDYDCYAPKVTEEFTYLYDDVVDNETKGPEAVHEEIIQYSVQTNQSVEADDMIDEPYDDDDCLTDKEREELKEMIEGFKKMLEEDD